MGIFSDIGDALFGDPNQSLNAQQKANNKSIEYTKAQSDQARADAMALYGPSNERLREGTQGAIDALGGTLKQQIDTSARGNYYAQDNLAQGAQQYQNAILGLPVDYSTMQPRILHPERNLDWMFNQKVGERSGGHNPLEGYSQSEIDALKQLSDAGLSERQIRELNRNQQFKTLNGEFSLVPGANNASVVQSLYDAGQLTGQDYNRLQKSFSTDPSLASGDAWSTAGSPDALLNRDWGQVSPEYRATLTRLFNSIYS